LPSVGVRQPRFSFCLPLRVFVCVSQELKRLFAAREERGVNAIERADANCGTVLEASPDAMLVVNREIF